MHDYLNLESVLQLGTISRLILWMGKLTKIIFYFLCIDFFPSSKLQCHHDRKRHQKLQRACNSILRRESMNRLRPRPSVVHDRVAGKSLVFSLSDVFSKDTGEQLVSLLGRIH